MTDASLGKHLEGWPLGLWLVGVTALSAALAVPRAVEPRLPPLPRVDRVTRSRHLAESRRLAEAAERSPLSRDVRAVGEAFRGVGRATYRSNEAARQLEKQLRRLARQVLDDGGADPLLSLRALQSRLFVRAATSRDATGPPSRELEELGGALLAQGEPRGWFQPYPDGASPDELHAMFAIHYAQVIGLDVLGPGFAPTLNDWRVHYRFLLSRPLPEATERQVEIQRRLAYVDQMSRHDPTYPAYVARGVLHFQAEDYAQAAGQLRLHLEAYPEGPWTLRAKNHLAACGARLAR